jgi:hypothetical protein
VNDILRGKPASGGDHGFAFGEPANFSDNAFAFFQNCRTACAMNGAIYAASPKKGRIRGVYDCFGCFLGYVARSVDLDRLIARQEQADREFAHNSSPKISAYR